MNLRNYLKPSIWTANIIRTTALIITIIITAMAKATTVFIDRMAIKEAERANAIYARRRTAVYGDIH